MATYGKTQTISINPIAFNAELVIKGQKLPDPKKHQTISFIKSSIRILGYSALPFSILVGAIILILSKVVGIYEELV